MNFILKIIDIISKLIKNKFIFYALVMAVSYYAAQWLFVGKFLYLGALFTAIFGLILFRQSPSKIIRLVFWATLILMFISHKFIQDNIFSIDATGFKTRLYWFIDFVVILLFVKMMSDSKYRDKLVKFLLFLAIWFSLFILLQTQPVLKMILALRSNYIFIPFIYLIYTYSFSEKEYNYYFKLFYKLAIINSILAFISLLYYGVTYSTYDNNSGIFGFNGTGIGVIFSVIQAILFIQLFLIKRNPKHLLFALLSASYIFFANANFGLILILVSSILLFIIYFRGSSFVKNILSYALVTLLLLTIGSQLLPQAEKDKTYRRLTEISALMEYDSVYGTRLGRIGAVVFATKEISESFSSFILGYGFGSVSYVGATSGFEAGRSEIDENIRSLSSLVFIYELGLFGLLIIVSLFFKLFSQWKKIKIKPVSLSDFYLYNIPILLSIIIMSFAYTSVLKYYFFMVFIGVNLSFLKNRSNSSLSIENIN